MTSLPAQQPPAIVLATLNAKYIHSSLGLRYLLANMGELRPHTLLREFTIARPAAAVAEEILAALDAQGGGVHIVGFGVYIWNVDHTAAVLRHLREARPTVNIILGGPEVSHETEGQDIVALADHVITGWGDLSFASLCRRLAAGEAPAKIIAGEQPPLAQIALPYGEYSDADLAHRLLYVEASRGCPFKCEFCLSALDKTAWAFDLDHFLAAMLSLYRRGARNFKFVDRTFNLKIDASSRILGFFLERLAEQAEQGGNGQAGDLFVHFEVVPDQLPERLKQLIAQFPAGVLQFEVGIQTFNVEVQQRISRKQDNQQTEINLRWLLNESHAHLHTDLIFGLPGESLASFAAGFDRLYALGPHEIQLGILKRLRGTPIDRHSLTHAMVYDAAPPYTVRQTGAVDATTMQRFTRFARYWDLLANAGRFKQTLPLLLGAAGEANSPFYAFLAFSDWLWQRSEKTSGLTPEALVDALFDYLPAERGMAPAAVQASLLADYVASGARSNPRALQGLLPKREAPVSSSRQLAQRQERHLAGGK